MSTRVTQALKTVTKTENQIFHSLFPSAIETVNQAALIFSACNFDRGCIETGNGAGSLYNYHSLSSYNVNAKIYDVHVYTIEPRRSFWIYFNLHPSFRMLRLCDVKCPE